MNEYSKEQFVALLKVIDEIHSFEEAVFEHYYNNYGKNIYPPSLKPSEFFKKSTEKMILQFGMYEIYCNAGEIEYPPSSKPSEFLMKSADQIVSEFKTILDPYDLNLRSSLSTRNLRTVIVSVISTLDSIINHFLVTLFGQKTDLGKKIIHDRCSSTIKLSRDFASKQRKTVLEAFAIYEERLMHEQSTNKQFFEDGNTVRVTTNVEFSKKNEFNDEKHQVKGRKFPPLDSERNKELIDPFFLLVDKFESCLNKRKRAYFILCLLAFSGSYFSQLAKAIRNTPFEDIVNGSE